MRNSSPARGYALVIFMLFVFTAAPLAVETQPTFSGSRRTLRFTLEWTAKLVRIQRERGAVGARVRFLAIIVDPIKNTPEALRGCGDGHGSKAPRWLFLTGTEYEIGELAGRDAIYMKQRPTGDVDHTVLTSLIDSEAVLRVQDLELRFDLTEYLENTPRSLLREGRR